jgi:hypothetical protein
MTKPSPDLNRPYRTVRERAYATVVVLRYWQLIEQLMKLVDMQPDAWSAKLKSLFPPSVPGGPPEHPQQRLERWLGVYGEEIRTLREVRNQLAHAVDISDFDLRGADYVARVILATLFDVMPSEVTDNWATAKVFAFSEEAGL